MDSVMPSALWGLVKLGGFVGTSKDSVCRVPCLESGCLSSSGHCSATFCDCGLVI